MTVIDSENLAEDLAEPLSPLPLHMQVRTALENYFYALEGETPVNLYKLVLGEVEPPLLETVLRYTHGNQTKAAEILGINRSTLRKKLKQYGME